jgi:predicted patatin/cPLA2 family phospholipase
MFAKLPVHSRILKLCLGLAIAAQLAGCASLERLPPVPLAQADNAKFLSISEARFYPKDQDRITAIAYKAYQRRQSVKSATAPRYYLAISGGGDDGAFGAGLLTGWTARGNRPIFDIVTGVSTGALSAPFAFLGPAYDSQLKQVYTESNADDIFQKRTILATVGNDALADNAPLRRLVSRYVDDALVQKIAAEYRKGRLLFILTTNLDQGRPVVWNIGAIAESGHPQARELIIDILLASSAIPAVFPPVMLDVTIDGQRYQEMHVDGGAVAQAFLYPPSFSLKVGAARLGISPGKLLRARRRFAYVIRNGRLTRPETSVERRTLAIAKQTIATMTTASGVNDTYRIYLITKRDGVKFNLAFVDNDFTEPYKGPFDRQYMNLLFDYGYQKGRAGYPWKTAPPGYTG